MLAKGKIKIQPHYSEYEINQINTIPAKEFIMNWFRKRIPSRRGGVPIIKPAHVGDRIMVLRSGTGSGKSTTLGPELYINFYENDKRNTAVTQPKVLTAMGIPIDIASIYPEMVMGETIGYQTGSFVYKPKKGVVFMTVGVLAQQLKVMNDEEFMDKYAFIIIDECHDRSLGMDLALSLIKQLIHRNYKNPSCPFLILTSATFDVDKYADFFGVDRKNTVDVMGLNYPIEVNFPDTVISDYPKAAADLALKIHKENKDDLTSNSRFTDILIFVYGMSPMKNIRKYLDAENEKLPEDHYIVIGLTGATFHLGTRDYQNIFKPLTSINIKLGNGKIVVPKRRIIISTNVAETGVTIDTLKYCIDSGFENSSVFYPVYGSSSLLAKCVTRASALQRKGRVGRRAPGAWYPLYPEEIFNNMQVDKFPDMISSDISDMMLGLIIKSIYPTWDGVISADIVKEGKFNVESLDLLDYPAIDSIKYSLEKLYVLGFIDAASVPTFIGLAATKITKMKLENTRMMFAGYRYGANIMDLITIAAFMTSAKRDYIDTRSKKKYTYENTFKKDAKELEYYNKFFIADDFIQTVFIWEEFMEQIEIMKKKLSIAHIKTWCADNGLVYEGLLKIIETRDDIIAAFIQGAGLDPYANSLGGLGERYSIRKIFASNIYMGIEEIRKLKRCIYEGYRLNTATWNQNKLAYVLDACHEKIKVQSDIIKPIPPHATFSQTRPIKIMVSDIDLVKNRFNERYALSCDRVSVVDGYFDADETFFVS